MGYRKRLKDLLIETVLAVALVTAYVIYLFHRPKGAALPWEWIRLIVNTTVVFGFLIAWFRYSWRKRTFWIALSLLLVCHLLFFSLVARPIISGPLLYFALINPVELVIFTIILKRTQKDSSNGT